MSDFIPLKDLGGAFFGFEVFEVEVGHQILGGNGEMITVDYETVAMSSNKMYGTAATLAKLRTQIDKEVEASIAKDD